VLDGPGFKPGWKRCCLYLYRLALRPTQPPVKWVLGFCRGVKRLGSDFTHPLSFSAEVKERVKPHLYFPSGLA